MNYKVKPSMNLPIIHVRMPCATISKNSGGSDMGTEISKLENERIRKWGTIYKLAPAEGVPLKVTHLRKRNETEKFKR